MTRKTRGRRKNGDQGDAELDALLAGTWEKGAAVLAGVLDLEAGKAALLSRARRDTAEQAGGALGIVLDRAGAMIAAITANMEPDQGPAHAHVATFLYASRQQLTWLRAGLAARSLGKDKAGQHLAGLDHALREAGQVLKALPAGPVTDDERYDLAALLAGLRAQIPELAASIDRLFDDAGDLAVPVPAL
jgi:hypothetical protein